MRVSTIVHPDITTVEFRSEIGVIRVNEFTEESAKQFSEEFRFANNTSQPVIPIIIDSYGGQVDSLSSMISDIRHAEKPVATIVVGKAMSCGSLLLSCGTPGYRYADPGSRIMIHEVSSGDFGKVTDLVSSTEETTRLNKFYFELLARNCKKKSDFILKEMRKRNNSDWFLTPKDAQTLGLVEHLFVPKLVRDVKVSYSFG
jgi:ATP-dependent Clp protease protease subunit